MIKPYLRYRRAFFGFYLCIVFFFTLVGLVWGFEMGAVFYSLLLFTFCVVIWMGIDYLHFRRRLWALREINANLSAHAHLLPAPADAIEAVYHQMVAGLHAILDETSENLNTEKAEQLEYYTMWLHQIKTPIAAMRLALQAEGQNNPVYEQELFKIEQYVEMALQYVKLKDLSSDLVIREYSLRDIVSQSLKKYSTLFIYKKLSVELGGLDQMVLTDSKWLCFVIEQFLSNAIKYTPNGRISIYLAGGGLIIEDTGIGIRAEDLERIFEKGYTGYNGRLDKKASGIGLYMAKKVADQLAIKIKLVSKIGQGTTVRLDFPFKGEFEE